MLGIVCPRCGAASPVRLSSGEPCARCRSDDAWEHWQREGKLVIDRAAIAALEARERGAAIRRGAAWALSLLSALAGAALAALSVYLVVQHLAPRPVGPLAVLVDALQTSSGRLAICGGASFAVGLASLRVPAPGRGRLALRATALASMAVGGFVALYGVVTGRLFAPFPELEHLSMPSRPSESMSVASERVTNATVVIVASNEAGDARGGALGTGAVVAAEAGRALVVTCSHVAMPYAAVAAFRDAASAPPVWVQLADGRGAPGRVVWTAEPPLDVALVEVLVDSPPEPVPLSPVTDTIDTDAAVFFVPNPYRHGFRVEHGRVLQREAHDTPAGRFSLLFTDLPLQHGDSGSGLFDVHGRLIGLNTWAGTRATGPLGISLPAEAMAEVARAMPRDSLGSAR